MKTQITPNFTLEEFFCKCPRCKGKAPSKAIQANIIRVIHTLQPYRIKAGKPFYVNCGHRCPVHNKEVGGVANSVHRAGLAADITIEGLSAKQMFELLSDIDITQIPTKPSSIFKGVGYYPKKGFVHVDNATSYPRPNT